MPRVAPWPLASFADRAGGANGQGIGRWQAASRNEAVVGES